MRSCLLILISLIFVPTFVFADSNSFTEVNMPTGEVACTIRNVGTSPLAVLDLGTGDYDIIKDVGVMVSGRYIKMSFFIKQNKDHTIDISMSSSAGKEIAIFDLKVPKAVPSIFNPQDASKVMASEVFKNEYLSVFCVSK